MKHIKSLLSFLLLQFVFVAPASAEAGNLVFILDASGSMWGQIEKKNKISIARDVLGDLVQGLPDETNASLIAYGHRRKGDCDDIETLVPLGPLNKESLVGTINALNPKGKTPITASVNQAFDALKTIEDPATIILVSDGLETCGGDPCQTVKNAKSAGIKFVMHVVGFGIEEENHSQLECTAQAGGGLYFNATNAGELSAALKQAVELPAEEIGAPLAITVTANGKLQDALVHIFDQKENTKITTGRTYTSENTNPRTFRLADGKYTASVEAIGVSGNAKKEIADIEIVDGRSVERLVDFSTGTLGIKVTMNGKLADATVRVSEPESGKAVAQGRTYTGDSSNPKIFNLTPGKYDVVVTPLAAKGVQKKTFQGIEITAGKREERSVEYGAGTLGIKVSNNGKLSDAIVKIYETATEQSVASGRTYERASNNPKSFTLAAGNYYAVIKSLKIKGTTERRIDNIDVKANEISEHSVEYESGTLVLTTSHKGKAVDATISIVDVADGHAVAGGRSYARAKEFVLLPGDYWIKTRGVRVEGDPKSKIRVTVTSGGTTEQMIEL